MNYLLVGPENYLKEKFIEKLKKSIFQKGKTEFDFDVLRGGVSEIKWTTDSFETLPFLSRQRLIVVKDIDKFSQKEKERILKVLKNPTPSTTIVLETPKKELTKFTTEASKLAKLSRYSRLKNWELGQWVKKEFTTHKKKIQPRTINMIIEVVGSDLWKLKNEIDKMVTFSGKRAEIFAKDVEELLGNNSEKTAFNIVDMILEKKADKAIIFFRGISHKEKPHNILNLLSWQFRNLLKIKSAPSNMSQAKLAELVNIRPSFINKALAQSKRFSLENVDRNLKLILEADFSIKTGKLDPDHVLESTLVGLCR